MGVRLPPFAPISSFRSWRSVRSLRSVLRFPRFFTLSRKEVSLADCPRADRVEAFTGENQLVGYRIGLIWKTPARIGLAEKSGPRPPRYSEKPSMPSEEAETAQKLLMSQGDTWSTRQQSRQRCSPR